MVESIMSFSRPLAVQSFFFFCNDYNINNEINLAANLGLIQGY